MRTIASIESYLLQLNNGKTKKDAARIFRFIKSNAECNKNDIINQLNLPHQTVTARLSELMDIGVVKVIGSIKDKNSTLSLLSVEEEVSKIHTNKQNRLNYKFEKWKSKAKIFGAFLSEETKLELISN